MKFMKKRLTGKEKGFTLVELLVVVAILGILAAVIIPNVTRFMGKGKTESGETELQNVQLAVTAMMADQNITAVTAVTAAANTTDMTGFPAGHPLYGDATWHNYVQKAATKYYYSLDVDGTVHGWWDHPGTKEIGVVSAP